MVYWNVVKSQAFVKNNCPSGYNGTSVTYTVEARTHSSTVSQAAADNLAQADIIANGQTNANNNGSCTLSTITVSYVNQTRLSGGVPTGEIIQVNFYSGGGPPAYTFNTAQLNAGVSIAPGVYDIVFTVSGSLYDPMTQYGWGSVAVGGQYVNYSDYTPSSYYIYSVTLNSNDTIYLQRMEIQ